IFVCLLLMVAFGFLLFQLLSKSLALLQEKFAGSKDKVLRLGETVLQYLGESFGMNAEQQKDMVSQFYENMLSSIFPFLQQTISLSATSLAMLLIIPIFVSLVLYYRELLLKFSLLLVPDQQIAGFKSTVHEMTATYFLFA